MTTLSSYPNHINLSNGSLEPTQVVSEILSRFRPRLYEPYGSDIMIESFSSSFYKQTKQQQQNQNQIDEKRSRSFGTAKCDVRMSENQYNDAGLEMGPSSSTESHHNSSQPNLVRNTIAVKPILKHKPFFQKKAKAGNHKVTPTKNDKAISKKNVSRDIQSCQQPERSEVDQICFECETTDHLQKLVHLYNKNRRFPSQSVRLEMIGDGTPVAVGESHVDSRPQAKTNGQVTELKQLQGQVHYYNRFLKSFQLRLVIEPPSEMVVAA